VFPSDRIIFPPSQRIVVTYNKWDGCCLGRQLAYMFYDLTFAKLCLSQHLNKSNYGQEQQASDRMTDTYVYPKSEEEKRPPSMTSARQLDVVPKKCPILVFLEDDS